VLRAASCAPENAAICAAVNWLALSLSRRRHLLQGQRRHLLRRQRQQLIVGQGADHARAEHGDIDRFQRRQLAGRRRAIAAELSAANWARSRPATARAHGRQQVAILAAAFSRAGLITDTSSSDR
jgi:hypothetical protein